MAVFLIRLIKILEKWGCFRGRDGHPSASVVYMQLFFTEVTGNEEEFFSLGNFDFKANMAVTFIPFSSCAVFKYIHHYENGVFKVPRS